MEKCDCLGRYNELTTEEARFSAIKLFVDHNIHIKISETAVTPISVIEKYYPFHPTNIRPFIYRILIEEITGRFESTKK